MPAAYTISIMGNALGLLEKNTELIDIFKDIIIRIKKIVFEELGGFNLVFTIFNSSWMKRTSLIPKNNLTWK